MVSLLEKTQSLKTYVKFNDEITKRLSTLRTMREDLEKISPFKLSIQKVGEFGHVLYCFYQMHTNTLFDETLLYSFGYHGFMDNMQGFSRNDGLNPAKFIDKKKQKKQNSSVFKRMYYPTLIDNDKVVKNDFSFKRNSIITGPNASGKTTILKTTLINVILTQQMGSGFYQKASLKPFKYIHCYLNIPDTSGRDSLFQAEARRCKEILDVVVDNKDDTHFCGFDELYSGTNPEEATKSAYSFLLYLTKRSNVDFILTTHYTSICSRLKKNKNIENWKMDAICDEKEEIQYTYKIKKGVSKIQGAIKVLRDMEYPKEIMDSILEWK
jgi:DNA mismatch repair ATPase MutS